MYYKDDFNVTFKEESAFYRYLDDVEKRAEWFRAQSKEPELMERHLQNWTRKPLPIF